jgi:hypothetical protein
VQYFVDPATVRNDAGVVTAAIKGGPEGSPALDLQITVTAAGVPRVRITEPFKRWEVSIFARNWFGILAAVKRCNPGCSEQAEDILLGEAITPVPVKLLSASDARLPPVLKSIPADSFLAVPVGDSHTFVCKFNPLKFELYRGNTLEIAGNEHSMFHFEWKRERAVNRRTDESDEDRHQGKEIVDYGEDGLAIYADGTREERKLTDAQVECKFSRTNCFGMRQTSGNLRA